jgi:phosphonopyruvate decarboxylase
MLNFQGKAAVTVDDLMDGVQWLQETCGPAMLEIRVCPGSRKDLGRPTRSPIQNKADFMNFLSLNEYE